MVEINKICEKNQNLKLIYFIKVLFTMLYYCLKYSRFDNSNLKMKNIKMVNFYVLKTNFMKQIKLHTF